MHSHNWPRVFAVTCNCQLYSKLVQYYCLSSIISFTLRCGYIYVCVYNLFEENKVDQNDLSIIHCDLGFSYLNFLIFGQSPGTFHLVGDL